MRANPLLKACSKLNQALPATARRLRSLGQRPARRLGQPPVPEPDWEAREPLSGLS